MLSELERLARACTKLDRRGIALDESCCLHLRHFHSSCRRCSAVCVSGAITCLAGLNLAAEKCTGCGACAAVCPSGALTAQVPNNSDLRSLIAIQAEHSGAVAFACETYLKTHSAERQRVIAVPCTARCNEAILVDAVLRGATGVFILEASCAKCPQHDLNSLVRAMAATANRLLGYWRYPEVITLTREIPDQIKPLLGVTGEVVGMSRRAFFSAFKRKGESLVNQVLPEIVCGAAGRTSDNSSELPKPAAESRFLPEKWRCLLSSLQQLPKVAVGTDFSGSLWGNIRISDDCNGCGACVEACPTAALITRQQDGLWSIALDVSRCTQCGLCQDVCCRASIEIIPAVDLDAMLRQTPKVLIVKRQEEINTLLGSLEQRMQRLLGCVVTS